MDSFTIEQSVEQINFRLAEEGLPANMNVRLLRHYQHNKSIPAPTQEGRFAKYSRTHVEAVVALRKVQDLGVSSKVYTTIAKNTMLQDGIARTASQSLGTANWFANQLAGAMATGSGNVAHTLHVPAALGESDNIQAPQAYVQTQRDAALQALQQLSGASVGQKAISPTSIKGLQATPLVYAARNTSSSGTISCPTTEASIAITEWSLSHGIRMQMPTATLRSLGQEEQRALEAWMAKVPNISLPSC